jgi:hypothetical protein
MAHKIGTNKTRQGENEPERLLLDDDNNIGMFRN